MTTLNSKRLIGIDLGTTNTVASFIEDGKASTIICETGSRLMPSVIAVKSSGKFISGENALRQKVSNPEDTFYSVKRLIGRRSEDVSQKEIENFDYKVSLSNERPLINSQILNKTFEIPEISAQVLMAIKKSSEKYLGEDVGSCVISVPAYFDNNQRTATKQAAEIAGLNVIGLINEPTAAAIAYTRENIKTGITLVCDLGGGTFDISLIKHDVEHRITQVLASTGDVNLGGDDFTLNLYNYFIKEIKKVNPKFSLDKRAKILISEEAEKVKCTLSTQESIEVNFPFLFTRDKEIFSFQKTITRKIFEEQNKHLFTRIKKILKSFYNDNKDICSNIDNVIAVGGSSRINRYQEIIREITNKDILLNLNPDEIVANGAALFAEIEGGLLTDTVVVDVTPLPLGTSEVGDIYIKLIEENTSIPTESTVPFTTIRDGQAGMHFEIFQGKRSIASKNILLGEMVLEDIEIADRGIASIDLTFEIDASGVLTCYAEDSKTGSKIKKVIKNSLAISDDEIERLKMEAKLMASEDELFVCEREIENDRDYLNYLKNKLGYRSMNEEQRSVYKEIKDYFKGSNEYSCKTLISKAKKALENRTIDKMAFSLL